MKIKNIACFIIVIAIFGCNNKSSQEMNSGLQGDATRKRIRNNDIIGAMDIFDNKWPVEFMIDAKNFNHTVKALNSISECVLITDFENHDISPADVHSWEAKMILFSDTIEVSKMTYTEWELPIFSFKWRESFDQIKLDSKIKSIEQALVRGQIKYTLVDYLQN